MSTPFEHTARIHGTREAILGAYTSEEFWRERIATIGAPGDSLDSFEAGADRVVVTVTHRIPEKDVPSAARKVVGNSLSVVRTTTYETAGEHVTGHAHAEAMGGLGVIDGSGELVDGGDGTCTESVSGTISVSVPLLGRKLEKMVLDYLDGLFGAEYRFLDEYVGRH